MAVIELNKFPLMVNDTFSKKEQTLSDNTTCYQLENGRFFLFKLGSPHTLSTVVEDAKSNHRKVDIILPIIEEELVCAGPYRDALYFYSTDDQKRAYTFYRGAFNEQEETIQFNMLRKIETGNETLRFAHQQPFYSCEALWKERLFGFDYEINLHVKSVNENDVFFMHNDKQFVVKKGQQLTYTLEYSTPVFGNVEIKMAKPENATIYSRRNGFLYIIAGEELYVFNDSKLLEKLKIHPLGYVRSEETITDAIFSRSDPVDPQNFSSLVRIVGVYGQFLVFCAANAEGGPINLWRLQIPEQYYDPAAYIKWAKSGETNNFIFRNSDGIEALKMLSFLITQKPSSGTVPENLKKRRTVPQRRIADKTAIRKREIAPSMKKSKELSNREEPSEVNATKEEEKEEENIKEIQMSTLKLTENVVPATEFHSKFANEFTVGKIIGVGGFGCVFKAMNKYDEWDYAVKRVAVAANAIDKALREVRAMARLEHPGIVGYKGMWIETPPEGWQHDADVKMLKQMGSTKRRIEFNSKYVTFRDDDVFMYIQMQLCNHSLSDWLIEHEEQWSRSVHQMKAWFKQIVSAVNYMHINDIVHRDLKPSNILFADSEILKVCDLGIATKRSDEEDIDTDVSRSMAGTKLYMSPEQLHGKHYSSKTDVFTLGLILAELLVVMSTSMRNKIFDNFRRGNQCTLIEDSRAEEFIGRITRVNPNDRPSCKEMIDHIFLA